VAGGRKRGYDPGKKLEGSKRHLFLVDQQGLVLKAKVHVVGAFDCDGIKPLMSLLRSCFAPPVAPAAGGRRLQHGGKGKGKDWAEKETLALSVAPVRPR
jgi:hypothetical protein